MPVPAGPMPNVTVCDAHRVDVALLPRGLGPHRLAPAQHLGGEHLGGPLVAFEHLDRAPHALGVEHVARLEQRHHLLEQPPDALGVGLVAADGDLVAAHVDVDRERVAHDAEQLVALTEQAHHQVVARDQDLDLGRRRSWHVGASVVVAVPTRRGAGVRVRPADRRSAPRAAQAWVARRPERLEPAAELLGAAAHHRGEHPEVVVADGEHLPVEVLALELDGRGVARDHRRVVVVELVQAHEVDGEALARASPPASVRSMSASLARPGSSWSAGTR